MQNPDTVKVRYSCGMYRGPLRWHGTERYEPDECMADGEVELDREEWEEGCASTACPGCGARLHQGGDHFSPL